jgi:glycerophosphoryl diester phosphodiesterase
MTTADWSPFVCAHRGASETCPENTLIAFEKAAEVGAGWIETDIQLLADNTLAVFHDLVLGRTAAGTSRVVDLTWEELATLDVGSWKSPEFTGQRPMRMVDLLSWQTASSGRPHINWEVKLGRHVTQSECNRFSEAIARVLEDADRRRHLLSTFDRTFLETARSVVTDIPMALNVEDLPDDAIDFCLALGLEGIHLDWTTLSEAQVRSIKREGLAVRCYTVNDLEAGRRLLDWGVELLMTDRPGPMLDYLRAHPEHPQAPL